MKFKKSVVSLKYNFCILAVSWSRWSTNDEIRSMRPSQPDMSFHFVLICCENNCWLVGKCFQYLLRCKVQGSCGFPGSSHDAVSFRPTDLWTPIQEGFIPIIGKWEIAQASGMSQWMEIKSGMHYVKNYGLTRKLTKSVNFNDLYFHQICI